ncbi:amidohydrolase family protein [Nocardioides sp. zg-1308]|uniref:amidohydrolase family protein n=1 Tax=Nocardioides sp. zg-1308 TaxID=2736253 RepID=UPI001555C834|nr:amidohydrolase family protein [Nocardioides sp. zg-1308]NPD04211.1 amidohydrolase family protein [Nocardioides sp. zg-1308]
MDDMQDDKQDENQRTGINRRSMLGGAAAAAGALGAAAVASPAAAGRGRGSHPDHGHDHGRGPREYVLTGGYVVSMDPTVGDLDGGDVHVKDGRIVAVGRGLRARGSRIDARGMVVMPGLVDTHWHLWTTLFRSMASSSPATAYFALNVANGVRALPSDLYQGARLALVDALNTGVTTVNDWSHNIRTPDHADANLQAHREVGLRGRFSYGTPQGYPGTSVIDLADIARVQREWFDSGRVPLMHLGLAGRPPGLVGEAVFRPEYDAARGLGLPVSYHANSTRAQGALQMVRQLAEQDMLGPDTQLIHALYTTPEERAAIRDSGASVSISPMSELLIGYGISPVKDMVDSGVLLTLSVDTLSLVGSADMWAVMRLTTGLHRGVAEQELSINTRRVLQMATIDGARSLGLGDVTGSLTPGKRADVVMVRRHDVATAPVIDVANTLALAAGAENVDTVIVDGRFRKRGGRLLDVDTERVVRSTEQAIAALLAR